MIFFLEITNIRQMHNKGTTSVQKERLLYGRIRNFRGARARSFFFS
jgi:hypothetical protein